MDTFGWIDTGISNTAAIGVRHRRKVWCWGGCGCAVTILSPWPLSDGQLVAFMPHNFCTCSRCAYSTRVLMQEAPSKAGAQKGDRIA